MYLHPINGSFDSEKIRQLIDWLIEQLRAKTAPTSVVIHSAGNQSYGGVLVICRDDSAVPLLVEIAADNSGLTVWLYRQPAPEVAKAYITYWRVGLYPQADKPHAVVAFRADGAGRFTQWVMSDHPLLVELLDRSSFNEFEAPIPDIIDDIVSQVCLAENE